MDLNFQERVNWSPRSAIFDLGICYVKNQITSVCSIAPTLTEPAAPMKTSTTSGVQHAYQHRQRGSASPHLGGRRADRAGRHRHHWPLGVDRRPAGAHRIHRLVPRLRHAGHQYLPCQKLTCYEIRSYLREYYLGWRLI